MSIVTQQELGVRSGIARQRTTKARQDQVLSLYLAGLDKAEIARRLDVSRRTIYRDLVELDDVRVKVEDIIEDCGLDATDVHITLSKMHDADLSDIVLNPEDPIEELRYKPIAQWPAIWRQGLAGKIKITPVIEETEAIGYKVEIERESLLKILELSAKLKQVNALSSPQDAAGSHGPVTINIVWAGQAPVSVRDVSAVEIKE